MDKAAVGVLPSLNLSFRTGSGIGRPVVERHGLLVEMKCTDAEARSVVADLAYAVHLPFNEAPLGRLNYAATDDDFRYRSLERLKECLLGAASDFPSAQIAVIHGSPYRWLIHEHAGAQDYPDSGTRRNRRQFPADHPEARFVEVRHGRFSSLPRASTAAGTFSSLRFWRPGAQNIPRERCSCFLWEWRNSLNMRQASEARAFTCRGSTGAAAR